MTSHRSKILMLIIAALLTSNIVLLSFMFWGGRRERKPPDRGKPFSDYFEKQLGFTPDQSAKFHILIDQHFETLKPIMKEVRSAKDSLFGLMRFPEIPDSILQQAADNLAQKEKAQELQSFRHFRNVRELCTNEQKPKFDTLINKMINRSFSRPPNNSNLKGSNRD
ncbi:MAG: periplasmic heavy metal sensor [Bacteroidetes bacterium]|nr:periplasmic heavy metal sensor [Bacteroidota bacterium]MBS1929830.1 periplasmic heavy metal sensor [Bacteroidota bacterium]